MFFAGLPSPLAGLPSQGGDDMLGALPLGGGGTAGNGAGRTTIAPAPPSSHKIPQAWS